MCSRRASILHTMLTSLVQLWQKADVLIKIKSCNTPFGHYVKCNWELSYLEMTRRGPSKLRVIFDRSIKSGSTYATSMAARLLGAQRAQQKQLNHGKRIHDGDPSNRAWRHHYIRLNEEKSTIAQSSEIGGRCMLCKKRDWSLCPNLTKDMYESWLNLFRRVCLCCKHDSLKNFLFEWSQINSWVVV